MSKIAEKVTYDYQPNAGGGNFLNLKAKGDKITIRFLDNPISYFVHWVDSKPTICQDVKTCPICKSLEGLTPDDMKKKENAQRRRRQTFIWPVADRADDVVKIFKSGVNIFLDVGEIAKDPKWGGQEKDASKFDVTITRTETSLQNFYSVIADPDSRAIKVTAEEKNAAEKLGPLIDAISTGATAADIADGVEPEVASEANPESQDDFIGSLGKDEAEVK